MIYRVWVCLEAEYDDIEADREAEAFEIASDAAMAGASWSGKWSLWRTNEQGEIQAQYAYYP